jgi:hypothetical protein
MADGVIFDHRVQGYFKVMKSDPVYQLVERSAGQIADAANAAAGVKGKGFRVSSGRNRTRSRSIVVTVTREAIEANAAHNTLLKCKDAGQV